MVQDHRGDERPFPRPSRSARKHQRNTRQGRILFHRPRPDNAHIRDTRRIRDRRRVSQQIYRAELVRRVYPRRKRQCRIVARRRRKEDCTIGRIRQTLPNKARSRLFGKTRIRRSRTPLRKTYTRANGADDVRTLYNENDGFPRLLPNSSGLHSRSPENGSLRRSGKRFCRPTEYPCPI